MAFTISNYSIKTDWKEYKKAYKEFDKCFKAYLEKQKIPLKNDDQFQFNNFINDSSDSKKYLQQRTSFILRNKKVKHIILVFRFISRLYSFGKGILKGLGDVSKVASALNLI